MINLKGISVSPGYASGVAVVYELAVEKRLELPLNSISRSQAASEFERLDSALEKSIGDLKALECAESAKPFFIDSNGVLAAHASLAEDMAKLVRQYIGSEFVNVEQALRSVITKLVSQFAEMQNEYFRQREQDVRDVGQRMMRHLGGISSRTNQVLPRNAIVVAHELLPSETIELAKSGIVGIVSEYGGEFSHTAILARSLRIPAISGIPHVTSLIGPGTRLLLDGELGRVVEPDEPEMASFAARKRAYDDHISEVAADEKLPSVTRDGVAVSLSGNICLPAEIAAVAEHNLAGIGLFRTEFLFVEACERPDLETQVRIYSEIANGLHHLPFVIRTFDLGGDKIPPFLSSVSATTRANLQLRGLRFSLAEQELLDVQLRAILLVARTADVRILFPMVIGSDDFARAVAAVDRVAADLGILHRPPVGAMIETPAALFALDEIFELADFVAIGTNDLTQFMLAVDRTSTDASDTCTAMHPAVLRAIKQIVEAASKRELSVCVCGEEAGHAEFSCLLVGLGVRELSLTPAGAAAVRHAIRAIDSRHAAQIADQALRCRTSRQVKDLCRELTKPIN